MDRKTYSSINKEKDTSGNFRVSHPRPHKQCYHIILYHESHAQPCIVHETPLHHKPFSNRFALSALAPASAPAQAPSPADPTSVPRTDIVHSITINLYFCFPIILPYFDTPNSVPLVPRLMDACFSSCFMNSVKCKCT